MFENVYVTLSALVPAVRAQPSNIPSTGTLVFIATNTVLSCICLIKQYINLDTILKIRCNFETRCLFFN
jgi:hypothetical protein